MRRILLVATALVACTALFAGAAVAKTFVCQAVPCEGTNKADEIGERDGRSQDIIRALGGDDFVDADRASRDADRVQGDGGDDVLDVGDGDVRDNVSGGPGDDTCIVDIDIGEGGFNIDGIRSCENPVESDESNGGEVQGAATTEGLRPLTAEEREAAEANYR